MTSLCPWHRIIRVTIRNPSTHFRCFATVNRSKQRIVRPQSAAVNARAQSRSSVPDIENQKFDFTGSSNKNPTFASPTPKSPPSPMTGGEQIEMEPEKNFITIMNILNDHDKSLSLKQLEKLIHSVLTLGLTNKIKLTETNCLELLKSLTRRELTCVKHFSYYQNLMNKISVTSSPYHPNYLDHRLSSRLSEDGKQKLRRGFIFLSQAIHCDMALQLMEEKGKKLNKTILENAIKILNLSGHHYMTARIQKILNNPSLMEINNFSEINNNNNNNNINNEINIKFNHLLTTSKILYKPTSNDILSYSQQLEELSSGSIPMMEQLFVLFSSSNNLLSINEIEILSLTSIFPLVSAKLEINREPELDRILRWRIMILTQEILTFLKHKKLSMNQLIIDELLRIYANCSAIAKSFALIKSIKNKEFGSTIKIDLTCYQWLLRAISIGQRWENPYIHANSVLEMMKSDKIIPDLICLNDVIRSYDRSEKFDEIKNILQLIKSYGYEMNETSHHYVSQAYVSAGEEEKLIEELLTEEKDKKEFLQEIQNEESLIKQTNLFNKEKENINNNVNVQ